jgi:hypothetical protein
MMKINNFCWLLPASPNAGGSRVAADFPSGRMSYRSGLARRRAAAKIKSSAGTPMGAQLSVADEAGRISMAAIATCRGWSASSA